MALSLAIKFAAERGRETKQLTELSCPLLLSMLLSQWSCSTVMSTTAIDLLVNSVICVMKPGQETRQYQLGLRAKPLEISYNGSSAKKFPLGKWGFSRMTHLSATLIGILTRGPETREHNIHRTWHV